MAKKTEVTTELLNRVYDMMNSLHTISHGVMQFIDVSFPVGPPKVKKSKKKTKKA